MVNSSVSSRISFTPKFMMLGLLTFKIFYDNNMDLYWLYFVFKNCLGYE